MARRVIIDANATLGLFLRLPYSEKVERWILKQKEQNTHLLAPILWEYECLAGIRKAVALNLISSKDADWMIEQLLALNINRLPPTGELHKVALEWAERIGHSNTYDAHYLALSESLAADFWTADIRLTNSVRRLGVDWIHCFTG